MKKIILFLMILLCEPVMGAGLTDKIPDNIFDTSAVISESKTNNNQPILSAEDWYNIVPPSARVNYMSPIKRPKWGYPLAWVGYAGTLFMVPFPIYMKNKDKAINANNIEYYRLQEYRERYEHEINQCQEVYSKKEDLLPCYQQAQNNIFMELNNHTANKQYQEQQNTNKLLKYQMIQNQFNSNRPRYYHSTVTPVGNTYQINTVGY